MNLSVLEEKLSFGMLWLTFSSKLDWGSYIIFIAKTASKKIGGLICSMKFLFPEVALYLYKSTIHPCHVWVGAPSFMVSTSKNKNIDHGVQETYAIISTQGTYEIDGISLLQDLAKIKCTIFFYDFYCDLKEKNHIKRNKNSKK